MSTARRITESEHYLRAGKWQEWSYNAFTGSDIHGSTLGVITGRPDLVELGALPYAPDDPMVVGADNRRLTEECGYTSGRTLLDGLSDTVRWWSQRREER